MGRFFYYFGSTVIIGMLIYLGAVYQFRLRQESAETFNMMQVALYSTVYYVIIGFLLKLPMLIDEIIKRRQWTFDWMKFIAIGLPSFCIILMYVFPLLQVGEGMMQFIPQLIFLRNPTIQIIASVVFGYILLDSLKK